MTNKSLTIGLVVVAIVAIAGLFTPLGSLVAHKLGGVTNYDEVDATAIKIGGSSGSRVGPLVLSTCSLIGTNQSQAASSTLPYDCAVTGVTSGDTVFALLASTTVRTDGSAGSGFWSISGAKASTTSGFVTVLLTNMGPAVTPSVSSVGSSTNILVAHPRSTVPGL